jgi:glucose-6-phosphate isomerase
MLPAALLGLKIGELLRGAREMDRATRVKDPLQNPAALLALMWFHAGGGHGTKDMVVLPYKDRLLLLSRYLQQLVMESLGKEHNLAGQVVHQGIVVYGNKGSTDQHAYIQQLRDGPENFFATFIEVLRDRDGVGIEVDPHTTSGDYLHGFLLGTRRALAESGRESITITFDRLGEATLGKLIALFERAVGFYATLVNINAYHQPGVEAGKKAAAAVLEVQSAALAALQAANAPQTADEIAAAAGAQGEAETVYHLLRRLAENPERGITRQAGTSPAQDRFNAG